jgi:hypothetical protein
MRQFTDKLSIRPADRARFEAMSSRLGPLSLAVMLASLAAACSCPASRAREVSPTAPPDTVRGLVVIVRTVDQPAVLIRPVGSAEVLPVDGPVVAALRDLEGFDVWIGGTATTVHGARSLANASDFRVLGVEGAPVRDGQLILRGDSLLINDSTGTLTPIVRPTEILRHEVDRRVWVAGPYDQPPSAFGVIHVTAAHDLRPPESCFDPRRPRRAGRPAD